MPMFISTQGHSKASIAICSRCSCKFPYDELTPDPNYPGLFVCDDDLDDLDPWRLPSRETENISLDHPRPDLTLTPGQMDIPILPLQAVINTDTGNFIAVDGGLPEPNLLAVAPPVVVQQQPRPWTANTFYPLGSEVTPGNATGPTAAGQEIWMYICLVPGLSGPTVPDFPAGTGREVTEGVPAGAVWLCGGLFLP
jgi:hypothetical protein